MWRVVDAVRRNLQNMKKSSRVADESMLDRGGDQKKEENMVGALFVTFFKLQCQFSLVSLILMLIMALIILGIGPLLRSHTFLR
ncbi:hypothetical protein HN51_066121 [Arachis hypogaea]|uniref:Uncharacterized protein n=1 Tax=Arachis hypogaea TaxID=3818 RepID=A0A444ZMU3_ARAHY|nr:uncharacterized protein DS421_14g464000 [Arachis hypogaea]RYR15531.1 hypothetical protein Ahy_B04g072321 [Arachis hypogaea]